MGGTMRTSIPSSAPASKARRMAVPGALPVVTSSASAPVRSTASAIESMPPRTGRPATLEPARPRSSSRKATGTTPATGVRRADLAIMAPVAPAPYRRVARPVRCRGMRPGAEVGERPDAEPAAADDEGRHQQLDHQERSRQGFDHGLRPEHHEREREQDEQARAQTEREGHPFQVRHARMSPAAGIQPEPGAEQHPRHDDDDARHDEARPLSGGDVPGPERRRRSHRERDAHDVDEQQVPAPDGTGESRPGRRRFAGAVCRRGAWEAARGGGVVPRYGDHDVPAGLGHVLHLHHVTGQSSGACEDLSEGPLDCASRGHLWAGLLPPRPRHVDPFRVWAT